MRRSAAALLALAAATPAAAQDREFCPERPGLETQACIVDRGRVTIETSLIDWTRDRQSDSLTDTILIGDTLVRVGVTDRLEVRAGWQPFGHERTRDAATGDIDRVNRVGDAVIGLKASLRHPDGKGLSIAILPSVTLPVGRQPIGAGHAQPSLLLPLSYDVSDTVEIAVTPAIRALANEDAGGQHVRYGAAAGVTVKLSEAVSVGADASLARDQDPRDHTTRARAAMTLAWQPKDDWQLDTSAIAGLNRDTPDVQLIAGVARRF